MDRELSQKEQNKTKRSKINRIISVILALLVFFFAFRLLLNKSVKESKIITSVATEKPIFETIKADGVIVPEFEEQISSPIPATIQKINFKIGNLVDTSQSIIKLNIDNYLGEYQKILDQLELAKVMHEKKKIQIEKTMIDLVTSIKIKKLENGRLLSEFEEYKKLLELGGGTHEDVEFAEMNFEIGKIELDHLTDKLENTKKNNVSELKELVLNIQIANRNAKEMERNIQLSKIRSSQKGVITWLNSNIGTSVQKGELLAKVANLNSYKIEGKISDLYVDKVFIGQEILIRINEEDYDGLITNMNPSVSNNAVIFTANFSNVLDIKLKPQMQVDIFLILKKKISAIVVENGSVFTGAEKQSVFVIKDNKAYRREIKLGLTNIFEVEIQEGLNVGEEIIISSLENYKRRDVIKIKK
jgi:HlyD family secretion protein